LLCAACRAQVQTALWEAGLVRHNHGQGEGHHLDRALFIMENRPTTQVLWRYNATAVLRRVTSAESRFSMALNLNEVAILAAADELSVATRDANTWLAANACPDSALGSRVTLLLDTCAEVAVTAEGAVTGHIGDSEAAFGRLGGLLAIIDFTSQTLDAW